MMQPLSKKLENSSTVESFDHGSYPFINRELSWLAFNARVLAEAHNSSHPLLERLRFLAISDTNLDEFFMVRLSAYRTGHAISAQSPLDQRATLNNIIHQAQLLMEEQSRTWQKLRQELHQVNFHVHDVQNLELCDYKALEREFYLNIFPILSPLAIDPTHPFPWIPNRGLAIAFKLMNHQTQKVTYEILCLPPMLPRFILVPESKEIFVPLEQVIFAFHHRLMPDVSVLEKGVFRLLRDSEMPQDEDVNDLLDYYEEALKKRRRGNPICLTIDKEMPVSLKNFVCDRIKVAFEDVLISKALVGLGDTAQLITAARPDLRYTPHLSRYPPRILTFQGDCFAAIRQKDLIVHHPFESFDVFINLLRQAAHDPQVIAIKQTLYRTSKDSAIVRELIIAAEQGKTVVALIEIRARFDEETNIHFARDLEKAGVQIVYGFLDLKTHAKLTLIVRREGIKNRSYAHFGTGNYHPINAKFYTDLSFFTADPEMCEDAAHVFNYITGGAQPQQLKKLVMSPLTLRPTLESLIRQEIDNAQQGQPAALWIKVNALMDISMANLLYQASQAGVQIDLIVRGMCCLVPGIPGKSDNIRVKSVIGRFLEHSRIFCFGNGQLLPSPQAKVFISSADWMTRNLSHRVELMIPLEDPTVHHQIMNEVMASYIKDNAQSWLLQKDGTYQSPGACDDFFSVHDYFMRTPSFSGQGDINQKMGII